MNQELIVNELVPPQGALFDYEALEAEVRIVIRQRAVEIKTLAKRVTQDTIEIGGKLAEVKDQLGGNGKFAAWVQSELGWSERTAYNFIAVHQTFGKSDIEVGNIAASALYLLSAASTPPAALETVKQIAKDGGKVTHTVAKAIVKDAKISEGRAKGDLFEEADASADEDEAVCFCSCRASDHGSRGCKICSCEVFEEASAADIEQAKAVEQDLAGAPATRDAHREGYERLRRMDAVQKVWCKSKVHLSLQYLPAGKSKREVLVTIQAEGCIPYTLHTRESDIAFIGRLLELLEEYKGDLPRLIEEKRADNLESQQQAAAAPQGQGTPFPTEHSKKEIERIAAFCCPDKLNNGKPVKICYILDQPHVITGTMGSGNSGIEQVWAWPVLPLQNVGERNAKTYDEASDEYHARLRKSYSADDDHRAEEVPEEDLIFSYQNIKINCGSVKKPDWWVMIGPEIVFTVKKDIDDFTAARCKECHRIDGAHTTECSQGGAISYQVYLNFCKAQKMKSPTAQARKLELSRERDEEVLAWMSAQNQALAVAGSNR